MLELLKSQPREWCMILRHIRGQILLLLKQRMLVVLYYLVGVLYTLLVNTHTSSLSRPAVWTHSVIQIVHPSYDNPHPSPGVT